MSDDDKRAGFQRFGRKDRKARLEPTGDLFPPEDPASAADPSLPADSDAPEKPLPFDDMEAVDEALNALSALDAHSLDEYGIPFAADDMPLAEVAPVNLPPPPETDERFPPIQPEVPTEAEPTPPQPAAKPRRRMATQDKIALWFLLGTILLAAWIIIIWNDPQNILNPLPPPTPYHYITTTPLPTDTPTTPTLAPTASFTPLAGVDQSVGTPSPYPFVMDESGVLYIPNDNGQDCNWASIAGTVAGLDGAPLNGYGVQVTGVDLNEKVFSGTTSTFGPGGFEIFLNGVPQQAQYFVQLFSPTGAPLSAEYTVITSAECDQNVALITFVQQHEF